jgi:hypothetical protein
MAGDPTETCSWCGEAIEPHDGWRLQELPGARRAAFCRLEHVVPWRIQGPHWEAGEDPDAGGDAEACAACGAALDDVRLVLVRHRGEHRIADEFCSVDHAADWAKSGGRWSGQP